MYYSQVRVDPTNPEIAYQGGAPFFKTIDGGKTWRQVQGIPHSDHHAIWIDPQNGNHMLLGNDGGLDVTYDQAETWEFVNTVPVGQFYAISADMRKPYIRLRRAAGQRQLVRPERRAQPERHPQLRLVRVGGGDGFYTANDPSDWTILYSESQDGATSRFDLRTGRVQQHPAARTAAARGRGNQPAPEGADPEQIQALQAQFGGGRGNPNGNIVPAPPPGTNFRFYWNTPFMLSPHNPATIYLGGDRLFRSYDRGDTWLASPDLTKNIGRNDRPIMGVDGKAPMASKHDGAASYSNIVTISESSVVPGVIWVGTNDGNVQVSRDGGATWKNVVDKVPGVPKETHVSRVEAVALRRRDAYVTFDGHRTDDHKPYVFKTTDFGETWTSIAGEPAGGQRQRDPARIRRTATCCISAPSTAFYISLERRQGVEAVHERPADGADRRHPDPPARQRSDRRHARPQHLDHRRHHGAAADDTGESQTADATLFDIRPATAWATDIQKAILVEGAKVFRGQNPARGIGDQLLAEERAGRRREDQRSPTSPAARSGRSTGTKNAGLNRVQWDLAPTRAGGSRTWRGWRRARGSTGSRRRASGRTGTGRLRRRLPATRLAGCRAAGACSGAAGPPAAGAAAAAPGPTGRGRRRPRRLRPAGARRARIW